MADISRMPLYRTIWRWHFYAGLFVGPFILVAALTGTLASVNTLSTATGN